MKSRYGAWDLVQAAGQLVREGVRAISPPARTTLPVGRGLWRVGWVLWGLAAVPTAFIAHEASRQPGCQWELQKTYWNERGEPIRERPILETEIVVPGIGKVHVPRYWTQYEAEQAIAHLRTIRPSPPSEADLLPDEQWRCEVQYTTNLPKMLLYSALGLSFGFAFIQGGFSLILWVILGFRKG